MQHPDSTIFSAIQRYFERLSDSTSPMRLIVAVSGGADSIALLQALTHLRMDIAIAHLDHTTRDGQSTNDALWVKNLANSMKLPYFTKRVNVPAHSKTSSKSFEEVARQIRYDFLYDTAKTNGYTHISTGHHGDDQAETILMRIIRGTSLTGLTGIPAVGTWNDIPIVRPLLEINRAEIIGYLEQNNFDFLEDTSNIDPKYVRNRVRHELLPNLREKFNPKIDEALRRLSIHARDDTDLLDLLSAVAYAECITDDANIHRTRFATHPVPLQRRILVQLAHQIGSSVDFGIIEHAVHFITCGNSGSRYDFGTNRTLSNGRDETIVVFESFSRETPVTISIPGEAVFCGRTFNISTFDIPKDASLKSLCTPTRQIINSTSLDTDVVVRHRLPGDRIRPLGMMGTRKLKDYFGDIGIPLERRDQIQLVATESEIIWIVGHAVSASFSINDNADSAFLIEVTDAHK